MRVDIRLWGCCCNANQTTRVIPYPGSFDVAVIKHLALNEPPIRCKNDAAYFPMSLSLRETEGSISIEYLERCFVTEHLENKCFGVYVTGPETVFRYKILRKNCLTSLGRV